MASLIKTYTTIAYILDSNYPNDKLQKRISHSGFDWDLIVIHGSQHLILPAIYCQLKAKNLLSCLPKDLAEYLNKITEINRNRNKKILSQIQSLSQLLALNNIKHCFLKGAALLSSDTYKDIGERMIGDIDILVDASQIDDAFNLIKENGYNKTYGFNYEKKGFRHMDRLINPNELAAVELHKSLLNDAKGEIFPIDTMLKKSILENGIYIPSKDYMISHLILAYQINDKGHFYNKISFKSLYDILALKINKNYPVKSDQATYKANKYIGSYIQLANLFFKDSLELVVKHKNYRQKIFLFKIKFKLIDILIKTIKTSYLFISKRLNLLFSNKSYRKHILKIILKR